MSKLKTTWEVRTYDVLGNATDDSFSQGETELVLRSEKHNVGTDREFISYYPSDRQIRDALSLGPKMKLDLDGDDTFITVDRSRDGFPLGELWCASHENLSGRVVGRKEFTK